MRSTFVLSIFLLVFSTLNCLADKRIALVIGNSNYQSVSPLANPRNDAALIAETLHKVGFNLVGGRAQLDLDKPAFDRAIQTFGNGLMGADVGLFYYAGHGVQVRNVNYLVPTSANPVKEADVDFQMVDVNLVLRQMEGSGTKLNLVILDACRNNPFGGRGLRGAESGLAQLRAPEGTLLSYATQPGNVALDGTGSNSPYSSALAQAIQRPGLDIFQTFNQVGLQVKRATGGSQQPWVSSSPIDGSFYFASQTPHEPVTAPPQSVVELSAPPRPVAIDPALEQRDRLCHRGHEAVAGQHRGLHELCPPVARRADRLLWKINKSRRSPQRQGEIRQKLADAFVSPTDGDDTNLVRSGPIGLPNQRRPGIQPLQPGERQEVRGHRVLRIRHQVWT
jgi:hypothetical protein